jgi:hypothetical protein
VSNDDLGDKMAKWGSMLGIGAAVVLLLNIVLDIGAAFIPAIGCITCLIWPIFFFGFIAAVLAIIFGIIALVKGTTPSNKPKAFMSLGFGIAYFVLGIGWAIGWAIVRAILF